MFGEIHALPVVVPLAAAAFATGVVVLRRRDELTPPRVLVLLVLCVYLAGILANTIFPIYRDFPAADRPRSAGLALVPLSDYEIADALMNVVVFAPLGALIPVLLSGTSSLRGVLSIAAGLSLAIEVTQYLTARWLHGGHIADVNDLLFNVIGAAVGYGAYRGLSPFVVARSRRTARVG